MSKLPPSTSPPEQDPTNSTTHPRQLSSGSDSKFQASGKTYLGQRWDEIEPVDDYWCNRRSGGYGSPLVEIKYAPFFFDPSLQMFLATNCASSKTGAIYMTNPFLLFPVKIVTSLPVGRQGVVKEEDVRMWCGWTHPLVKKIAGREGVRAASDVNKDYMIQGRYTKLFYSEVEVPSPEMDPSNGRRKLTSGWERGSVLSAFVVPALDVYPSQGFAKPMRKGSAFIELWDGLLKTLCVWNGYPEVAPMSRPRLYRPPISGLMWAFHHCLLASYRPDAGIVKDENRPLALACAPGVAVHK
ncbi:hypothetical protein BKA70DRAFT_1234226 [Coprinopsis sp. MPI-PUGE-AT-0042]|nr:hypothetical protein BKA70DRAFT_1234226 [Coprinopsis sp. MPI-PUGE-AT-0042]